MRSLVNVIEALGVLLMLFSSLIIFYLLCFLSLGLSLFKPAEKPYEEALDF